MNRTALVGSIFALTAFARMAHAEDTPPKRIAIRAAHLIDPKTRAVLSNAVILVEGDRIKEVGASIPVPPYVEVIDLGSATITNMRTARASKPATVIRMGL